MANNPNAKANLTTPAWQPGQSGNPGGKPKHARNRVTTAFLEALAEDFTEHGKEAIEACRQETPHRYVAALVQLCPKQIEVERPMSELSDEQLAAAIAILGRIVADSTAEGTADRGRDAPRREPPRDVLPVH